MSTYRYRPGFGHYYVLRGGQLVALKPGEEIQSSASGLGAFANRFELVKEDPKPPLAKLLIKPRGHGRYDVINPDSRLAINDTPLSKEDAAALVQELGEPRSADSEGELAGNALQEGEDAPQAQIDGDQDPEIPLA